jgi:hypothetical protein
MLNVNILPFEYFDLHSQTVPFLEEEDACHQYYIGHIYARGFHWQCGPGYYFIGI